MYWHFASGCIQTDYPSTCLVQDLVESYGLHNKDYIFIVNHYSLNLVCAHTSTVFDFSSAHIYGLLPICQQVGAGHAKITKIQHLPFGSSQFSRRDRNAN